MDLNQSKCGEINLTRNVNPVKSHYHLMNNPINSTNVQKGLGALVTSKLKWNVHVSTRCTKAKRMLEFIPVCSKCLIHSLFVLYLFCSTPVTVDHIVNSQ